MTKPVVQIKSDGKAGGTHILVDGMDLSHVCTKVTWELDASEHISTVRLELFDVELEALGDLSDVAVTHLDIERMAS